MVFTEIFIVDSIRYDACEGLSDVLFEELLQVHD